MTDTTRDATRDTSQFGDLSGISEMFGLRDGQQADSGTRTGTDTVGRWVAATEGVDQPPDVSSRLVHGRYRLIAELGVGGMGVTYRAWDAKAGIPVVVKMPRREVRRDSEAMQRFAREIDAMLVLPHDHIVPITDHGDDEGCPFVVMRFLPGGSLADYRRRDDAGNAIRNPPGMLHSWLPGVAAALDHIHSKGMLHRDVKPGNIFLDGFLKPYLGDFGIAKVVDESGGLQKEQTLTATKMAVGTPEYMAPELFKPRSKPDGRVDQYALAVTVYEMLAGEKPFKGDRAHIIVEHSALPVTPLSTKVPGLPQSLCMAVERALSKNAVERFTTCSKFVAAVLADLVVLPPEHDTVRLLCPSCKNILKLPRKAAGRTGKCPRCQAAMDVAADLGSMWLEAEEQGGGLVTEKSATTPLPLPEKPDKFTWRARSRAIVGLAALGVASASMLAVIAIADMISGASKVALDIVERREAAIVATEAEKARVERDQLAWQHAEEVRRLQGDVDDAKKSLTDAEENVRSLEERVRSQEQAIAALEKARDQRDSMVEENVRLRRNLKAVREESEPTKSVPIVETLTNSLGMRFNRCNAGKFRMGSLMQSGHAERDHYVTLTKPFYIGVCEVTRADWYRVMGDKPAYATEATVAWRGDARAANNVTWEEAVDFCRKLSAIPLEQRTSFVYRLPTEAEWEYACRAGTTGEFSFGNDGALLGDYGWFVGNSGGKVHPVGQKKPNAWGLHDMHGNVQEWIGDGFRFYNDNPVTDPQEPLREKRRYQRGGCYAYDAVVCTSSHRDMGVAHPSTGGFRLVLNPPGSSPPDSEAGK